MRARLTICAMEGRADGVRCVMLVHSVRFLERPRGRGVGKSIILDPNAPDVEGPTGNDPELQPGKPKYKPAFLAQVKELDLDQVHQDPAFTCGPPGVPRIGPPQRIVQTARELVILYDQYSNHGVGAALENVRPARRL